MSYTPTAIVTGTFLNDQGSPVVGLPVNFSLTTFHPQTGPWKIAGTCILSNPPDTVTVTTNADGFFTVTLWGNDVITVAGGGSYYEVLAGNFQGAFLFVENTTYNLLTAVPLIPFPGTSPIAPPAGSQAANTVYAGPEAGGPAIPTFRPLVSSDIPNPINNLNNVITPQLFGAVQDGVTDNSVALQNALNYAAANNAVLSIPPGPAFAFATTLRIHAPAAGPFGLAIKGDYAKVEGATGPGSGLLYTGTADAILVEGATLGTYTYCVSMSELYIGASAAATALFHAENLEGPAIFDQCNFESFGATLATNALLFDNGGGAASGSGIQVNVTNSYIQGFSGAAIKILDGGPINLVQNQYFNLGTGIYISNAESITISDSYFELMTVGVEIGNDYESYGRYDIHGNQFNVGYSQPLSLPVNTANQRALLVKSTDNGNPIYMQGSFKHNNVQVGTGFTQGIALYGIQFSVASNIFYSNCLWEIEDNLICGMATCGIYADSATVTVNCRDNVCNTLYTTGSVTPTPLPEIEGSGTYNVPVTANLLNQISTPANIALGLNFTHWEDVLDEGYGQTAGSHTDTLKILLPVSQRWSYTLMHVRITGYDFSSSGAWVVDIGGYNSDAAGGEWTDTSATITGNPPFTAVRLGDDGTQNCILLGTTSTVWQDPSFSVDIWTTLNGATTSWSSGWSYTFLSSEAGITVSGSPVTTNSTGAMILTAATPTAASATIGLGTTTGFGNGSSGTAVTTTAAGSGSGPATPQTVVDYLKISIGGTAYWIPLFQ